MTRRVLVTAGAAGIGLAIARRFAAEGARVIVTDIDEAAIAALPEGIDAVRADVTEEPAMVVLSARLGAEWGGLDVLCANAGVKGPTARVTETPLEGWRDCVGVNLEGAFLTAKHMLPLMGAGGVILFTSSTAGIYGFPYRAPYAAAKWGVIGLMKTVAMEEGPRGIRANAILPGSVRGPRIDRVFAAEAAEKGMTVEDLRAGYEAGTALRALSEAEDVAEMAFFLASPAARMVSGQAIAVDGFTINPDPQV